MSNPWNAILDGLRAQMAEEDFRHWFGGTSYASDSGDQITVWVPSEAVRRHLEHHFRDQIDRAGAAIGRSDARIRFIVAGFDDDDEPGE